MQELHQAGSGLVYASFFPAVLDDVLSCYAASPFLSCREQGRWGLPVLGHHHRRVRNLVCLVAVLPHTHQHDSIPTCVVAPTRAILAVSRCTVQVLEIPKETFPQQS